MDRTEKTVRGAGGGLLGCGRSGGEPDLLLRWGNRKRLRCGKIQVRDVAAALGRTTPVDPSLRRRAPTPHRPLGYNTRNTEASAIMKAQQQEQVINNGSLAERPRAWGRKAAGSGGGAPAAAKESGNRKGGGAGEAGSGGSSSSSGSEAAAAWPNVVIALTAREKEEDFMAFKGTKLPQRPKKRAKLIQRTLNQVSPGAWLCDLTLERYEVREKVVCKKQTAPRGLKAMGSMEGESA